MPRIELLRTIAFRISRHDHELAEEIQAQTGMKHISDVHRRIYELGLRLAIRDGLFPVSDRPGRKLERPLFEQEDAQ